MKNMVYSYFFCLAIFLKTYFFRDSLTDMTLIMYAVKSGASGVGNVDTATKITEYLIDQGADLSARYFHLN
jgi:hypothetical protein